MPQRTLPTSTRQSRSPAGSIGADAEVRSCSHRRDRTGWPRSCHRLLLSSLGSPETVVQVTGRAVANPQAPCGVEIIDAAVTALSGPATPPPFDLYRPTVAAGLPVILDNAGVALRHPLLRAPFEIAAAVAGFRAHLDSAGFTEIHTPKIVGAATESGANVFGIDYFGRKAFLAQSPQFYKQTMVGVFERVYEVGPVFRAEPHDTARHLAEYTSLDVEFAFITDHHDVMDVLTDPRRDARRRHRAGRRRRRPTRDHPAGRARAHPPDRLR